MSSYLHSLQKVPVESSFLYVQLVTSLLLPLIFSNLFLLTLLALLPGSEAADHVFFDNDKKASSHFGHGRISRKAELIEASMRGWEVSGGL